MKRGIEKFGKEMYPFWPKTFGLEDPTQFDLLKQIFLLPSPPIFIIKRPSLPKGLGVHLVSSLEEVEEMLKPESSCYPLSQTKPIAQQYITDVLTIEGFKVTFRIYVAITSADPMRIYVFTNGLGRICSRKYSTDLQSLKDTFIHIDSINLNEENEDEFLAAVNTTDLKHEGLRVYFGFFYSDS
jgi:tubulin polyglutamylase TTLL4